MSFNLAVVLRESARSNPDKIAIIAEDRALTYAEIDQASDLVAGNLALAGIGAGDIVGLQLPNVPEFAVALYGIIKAGAVALPMNILNKAPEVSFFLADSRAKAMIIAAEFADEGSRGAEFAGVHEVYVLGELEEDKRAQLRDFDELLAPFDGRPPFVQRDPGDAAILLYTSGTTGKPKGVELTHFQLFMNGRAHIDGFEMNSDTVVIAVMPLFHTLGLSGILNAALTTGGTVVLIKRFDAVKVFEAIEKHRATLIHGVPTMYHELLKHPQAKDFDTTSLQVCGSAGAPIASELLDSIEREFGVVVLEAYGLTESGPIATVNRRDCRKPYSIGTPVWGVEVEIWDAQLNQLPPGRDNIGEIVIRGHNTMRGYLNNPQATEEAFAGGWLHSGDLGYQDEDGFFFIVDRKKEMIIRGGYNVYPREVEEVLYAHPAVNEAAVIGVPDERLGEEVIAFVSLKAGVSVDQQMLIDYVKAQVAAYKYPRFIEFIDALPKSPTGKILKMMLRDVSRSTSK
jgi:long-chain acyl-CoA synthetase